MQGFKLSKRIGRKCIPVMQKQKNPNPNQILVSGV